MISAQGVTISVTGNSGGLKAVGTSSKPIIFTAATKAPKAWKGIYFDSEYAANEIAYVKIKYSGLNNPDPNVSLWFEAFLNIHDVTFSHIAGCGINYKGFASDDYKKTQSHCWTQCDSKIWRLCEEPMGIKTT